MSGNWKNYRRRFVPWLAINLKSQRRREVTLSDDKITSDEELLSKVQRMAVIFHDNLKLASPRCSKYVLSREQGFGISLGKSKLKDGGTGVFLSSGCAKEGNLIAMYPGTIYRRFEPILLPSIGNSFVLRCVDGIHIDGNNKYLSKLIYKSCVNRDSDKMCNYIAADLTWLSPNLASLVPWSIGQYVNNSIKSITANVAYQELEMVNFPSELHYLLPNIWFSGPQGRHLRTVLLVATRNIIQGEEILSNYVTLINQ